MNTTDAARRAQDRSLATTIVGLNLTSALAHLSQFGILYPMLALWLDRKGMPTWQIGWVGSAVWVGLMIGNLCTPSLLRRYTPVALTAAVCLATSVISVAMSRIPATQPWGWLGASLLLGVCVGVRWISVEGWLYAVAPSAARGGLVGVHETLIHLAQTIGPTLVAWVGLNTDAGFWWASACSAAALMPLAFSTATVPARAGDVAAHADPVGPWRVLQGIRRHLPRSLALQLGLLAGLVDGVVFGMLAVYLLGRDFSVTQASLMLTVFGAGGLLSQVPLGWLSDRKGVRFATQCASAAGVLGVLAMGSGVPATVWVAAFLLGIVAGGGLTLAIVAGADAADRSSSDMNLAMTELSITFAAGSALGPALTAGLMDHFGNGCFLGAALLSCLGLGWIATRRELS